MAQRLQDRTINDAVELLKVNGFDGMAEAMTVLLNSAMVAERSDFLGAAPYERRMSAVQSAVVTPTATRTKPLRPGSAAWR